MLMPAVHMDSSSTTTTTPQPPWLPVLTGRHQFHHLPPSPSPSPPPPTHHHSPPRAARRVTKRRPRPSRRLPTTYISADAASFRRMVHQVTGADDLVPPQTNSNAEDELLLARPAPVRVSGAVGSALLPTLDTSAFLVQQQVRPDYSAAAAPALEAECHSSYGTGDGFPTLESWDDDARF